MAAMRSNRQAQHCHCRQPRPTARARQHNLQRQHLVPHPRACRITHRARSADKYGAWLGIALDFKAARKTVKIREDEQGTVLFEVADKPYHYTVCHFGAIFGLLVGSCCRAHPPHPAPHCRSPQPRSWLYVDDLLALFQQHQLAEGVCLIIALLASINAPISWKKAQVGDGITWCGWSFNFAYETIHLADSKLAKLREQLQQLLHGKKLLRKRLEATLGLLMWATCTCQHLRPYMAPLYRDLHSAAGTLKLIHPQFWQPFLDALDPSAKVIAQPPGLWLPFKARVIAVGGTKVSSKMDLPKVPAAHKGTWVRIADPSRAEAHLTAKSRSAVKWLQQCFAHERLRPLQQAPLLSCFAAADVVADDRQVGIGGWIVTASQCAWFAECWTTEQVRALWPQLTKHPQQYIACFETI